MNYKLTIGILIAIIIVLIIGLITVMPNLHKEDSKIVMTSSASLYENESFTIENKKHYINILINHFVNDIKNQKKLKDLYKKNKLKENNNIKKNKKKHSNKNLVVSMQTFTRNNANI